MTRAKELSLLPTTDAPASLEPQPTLVAYASTVMQDPSATVTPPRAPSNDGTRAALAAFERLGDLLRSKGAHGLVAQRTLGEGGMGVVRLARQVALDRDVAVKTLKDSARTHEQSLDLLREAWITGGLEHPNVVPVYDVAMDAEGGPAIVLKRIEGVVWSEVLRDADAVRERFGAGDLLEWNLRTLMSVCNAVAFAHERGIVHRDLKPENVMLGRFGEVYVLDWGIAVTTRPDDARLPRAVDATAMAGTPHYMAPEMLGDAAQRVGPHSDVYLLGAMLFELLTGRPPHEGPTLTAMIASILTSDVQLSPSTPIEIADVCRKAMAREPADRFGNVELFRTAIDDFLRHRGSLALTATADLNRARLSARLAAGASLEEVYALLGECRFGYRAARSSWSENRAAVENLNAVLVEVAEHELARGKAHAASLLLAECTDRPHELARRIDDAMAHAASEQKRLGQLEFDNDVGIGRRTRLVIVAILGVIWTSSPVAAQLHPERVTVPVFTASATAMVLFFGGLGYWARESMTKTLVNRRLFATALVILLAQLGLALLAAGGAVSLAQVLPMLPVLHTMGSAMVAVWLEPRVWLSTAVGALSAAIALVAPAWTFAGISLYSLVLTLNIGAVWYRKRDLAFRRSVPAPPA
jgi:serine/threonine-protein kinase